MLRLSRRFLLWNGLLLMLLGAGAGVARAQPVLLPDSKLWIEGTSTLDTFRCHAQTLTVEGPSGRGGKGMLRVPVGDFNCGNRVMNRDLARALRAEDHPVIRFELTDVYAVPALRDKVFGPLAAGGRLTVAGATRTVMVEGTLYALGEERYRLVGRLPLRMTDYGVDPPSALLGLVRARDRFVVYFDLEAYVPAALMQPVGDAAPDR